MKKPESVRKVRNACFKIASEGREEGRKEGFLSRLMILPLMLIFVVLTACGGGSGGGGSASPNPTASITSTASSSGAMGVAIVSGATVVATPAASGSTSPYLSTLPNTGTLTGATVSSAQFVPISVPAITTTVNGTNLDPTHSIGVAFSYSSSTVAFFNYSSSATSLNQISSFVVKSAGSALSFSGGSAQVAGIVLDPTNQWAIVAANDGYEIWSYANPSSPSFVKTIPSSIVAPTNGIDMAENFAYDSIFSVGGTSYRLILSGGDPNTSSTQILELADANTGTVYKPDTSTATNFSSAIPSGCETDQFGIDTNYQVAILGCEFQANAVLVNLNALTLNSSAGTYSLPASAIKVITTGSNNELDNVAIESATHTVFIGAGGYATPSNQFELGVLSNPSTSFGFSNGPTMVTMPNTSSSNIINCSIAGCTPISPSSSWEAATDPHALAAYQNASGDAKVLWMNNSLGYMAVIDLTQVLTSPASPPAASIWYQGIP
ncbi:MAG: hypothetical protein ACYCR5_11330 [Leptospirillum sp.]